jgi:NAD-dependent deacetylase
MDRIAGELARCDFFVTIGSSGAVYPAAGFVSAVRGRASRGGTAVTSVYVGPERPDNADLFDQCRLGNASEVVPGLFRAE